MKVDLCLNPKKFTREEVLARLPAIHQVLSQYDVQLAYLFGSVVSNAAGPLSDVDIAILPKPSTRNWLEVYSDFYSVLVHVLGGDNVEVVLLAQAPLSIRFAVVKEGLLIWSTDPEIPAEFADATIGAYLDTQPLRDEAWSILYQHIREGLSKTMRQIDLAKVKRLLGKMDESIGRLRSLNLGSQADFLAEENWQNRGLVEHFLRIAVEAGLDVGRHILVAKSLGIPEEYKDVARMLRDNRIVPQSLGDKWVGLAGLRNVLVHLYWDIDYAILYQIVTTELTDFDEYVQAILDYISAEPSKESI